MPSQPSLLRRFLADPAASWRTASSESQGLTLSVLLAGVGFSFLVSVTNYSVMPVTAYFIWLLLGTILLRFERLVVLAVVTPVVGITAMLLDWPPNTARVAASISLVVYVAILLFTSSRTHGDLPGPISDALLSDLRDRLRSQGKVPPLPQGWVWQSALVAANGGGYGGDFVVTRLSEDKRRLEVMLVDVVGKGVPAASRALHFGGALAGLIGALPPLGLVSAANDFLLRQRSDENFATAVHALIDLETGDYNVINAGHPPALVWSGRRGWVTDSAEGTALGIVPQPQMSMSYGTLQHGQALLFYTDGVVETRENDLESGIDWLRRQATLAIETGFEGAAARILAGVEAQDDDRAVLILQRA